MTKPRWATRAEALAAGWFSRRHETSAAHDAARAWWKENKGKAGRVKRARERENS